jgi:hypothetical protein
MTMRNSAVWSGGRGARRSGKVSGARSYRPQLAKALNEGDVLLGEFSEVRCLNTKNLPCGRDTMYCEHPMP